MQYKKLIAGISAVVLCAVGVPFATAFADEADSSATVTVTGVDDSKSVYTTGFKAGDANLDGKTNVADCVTILKHVASASEINVWSVAAKNANVTGNVDEEYTPIIDADDAKQIANSIIGKVDGLKMEAQPQAKVTLSKGTNLIAIQVDAAQAGQDLAAGYEIAGGASDYSVKAEIDENGIATFEIEATNDSDVATVSVYSAGDLKYSDKDYTDAKIGLAVTSGGSVENTTETTTEAPTDAVEETTTTTDAVEETTTTTTTETEETTTTTETEETTTTTETEEATTTTETEEATTTTETEEATTTTEATKNDVTLEYVDTETGYNVTLSEAVGTSKMTVTLSATEGSSWYGGAVNGTVEVNGNYYWFAYAISNSSYTVDFTQEPDQITLENVKIKGEDSDGNAIRTDEDVIAAVTAAVANLKDFNIQLWYAEKGTSGLYSTVTVTGVTVE